MLVNHLGDIIQTENKGKFHDQMLELIITLIRNLCIKVETSDESIERALWQQLKSEGVLDAMIYLCQDV